MNDVMLRKKFRDSERERKALIVIRRQLEKKVAELETRLAECEATVRSDAGIEAFASENHSVIKEVTHVDSLDTVIEAACNRYAERYKTFDHDLLVATVRVATRWLKAWRQSYSEPDPKSINGRTGNFITDAAFCLSISENDIKNLVFDVLERVNTLPR